jgi:hypothetical protein
MTSLQATIWTLTGHNAQEAVRSYFDPLIGRRDSKDPRWPARWQVLYLTALAKQWLTGLSLEAAAVAVQMPGITVAFLGIALALFAGMTFWRRLWLGPGPLVWRTLASVTLLLVWAGVAFRLGALVLAPVTMIRLAALALALAGLGAQIPLVVHLVRAWTGRERVQEIGSSNILYFNRGA